MSNQRHRRLRDLKPGHRVLVGSNSFSLLPDMVERNLKVLTVVENEPDVRLVLRDEDGNLDVREYLPHSPGEVKYNGKPSIVWTSELPVGDERAVMGYAKACLAASRNNCGLFHVRVVTDGIATASLVQPAGGALAASHLKREDYPEGDATVVAPPYDPTNLEIGEMSWEGRIVGNAGFWKEEVRIKVPANAEWKAGDLVIAPDYSCEIRDGNPSIRLKQIGAPNAKTGYVPPPHCIVLGNMDERQVGAFLPWANLTRPEMEGVTSYLWSHPSGCHVDYLEEVELAKVRLEPSEALVVWYRDEDGKETSCACLGSSGIAFYRVDSITDNFYGENVSEGLWVFENAKAWSSQSYEGEWDGGIDGDWRPATVEDLERFGLDPESASREIADHIDRDFELGMAESMMEAARKAAEAERAAVPTP